MFTDPQSFVYAAATKTLPRIGGDENSSRYRVSDAGVIYALSLSHAFKARNRVVARLSRDSFVADPLQPALMVQAGMTGTLTLDFPSTGLTVVDAQNLGLALVGWATAANILKLANGET